MAGSVLVHRTVDAPSASVYPNVPSRPLRVHSVSCVAYLSKGIRRSRSSLSAPSPRGLRGGRQARPVFPAGLAQSLGCLGPRCAMPVLSDAERYARAWGLLQQTGSVRPSNAFCPSTRTTAVPVSSPRPNGPSGVVRASASRRNATWLILPVVICLSQRLSHACVSMN